MIRRAALPVLWCAAALAQLPSPQSAPPKPEPEHNRKASTAAPEVQLLRVDARVTDFEGRPKTGLTAADFTVETDGKPQKVEQCRYVEARPVRVALVVDNLSLSRPHLTAVKTALHQAIAALPPGHEFTVMRTSGGEGALEQLTSDRALLTSALDQIADHSLQADPAAFQVGTLGTLEAVLNGLNLVPGRKAVLLFSEGLRDPQRARGFPREVSLKSAARRASAVVYAYDAVASAEQAVTLDEGIAALADDSGGRIFERGVEPAQALEQVLRDQAGYYSLTFTGEGLSYDYLYRMPRVDRLVVKVPKNLVVRAPKGARIASDSDAPYISPGAELRTGVNSAFSAAGIRTRLTPLAGLASPSSLDAVLHVDARDITLTRKADSLYYGQLEVRADLFGGTSAAVEQITRGVNFHAGEATLREILERGFDCRLTLNVQSPGIYLLRAAVSDGNSSRLGSAGELVRIPDAGGGKLALSSIILRNPTQAPPDSPISRFLDENAPARVFPPGFRIPYTYSMYNLKPNADKHAQIEVRTQLSRDGVAIYTSEAKTIEMDLSAPSKPATAGGVITLTAQTPPGRYTLSLTVTDKLGPPPAAAHFTQTVDFQVRP